MVLLGMDRRPVVGEEHEPEERCEGDRLEVEPCPDESEATKEIERITGERVGASVDEHLVFATGDGERAPDSVGAAEEQQDASEHREELVRQPSFIPRMRRHERPGR